MAELIVVSGPPGAGKSTVAALLVAAYTPAALIPGDAFFAFVARGAIAPWLPAAYEQNEVVVRAAAAAAGTYAAGGSTVVYDGVIGPWFLPAFTAASGVEALHYVVLLPSLQTCLERVATRIGHGFTDPGATRHMHADFAGADIEARHVLADPPDRPEEVAGLVLERLAAGTLLHRR